MATFTNHNPGARGVNLKSGGTRWIEPGETVEIDDEDIDGKLPDFGKDAGHADQLDAANTALNEQVTELQQQVSDLTDQLDAANTALKPYLVKDAVAGLDGTNDAHWTKGGLPATEAVSAVVGSDVSRADIEAAAPDAKRAA
jgi:tetrahydromethanopterin S-methyltransferase subunit B